MKIPGTLVSNHGRYPRQVHAALRRTENELNRVDGAGNTAGAVANAVGGSDQHGLSVNQTQHLVFGLLRASLDAGAAADTDPRIHDGVQGWRFRKARCHGLFMSPQVLLMKPTSVPGVNAKCDRYEYDVDKEVHGVPLGALSAVAPVGPTPKLAPCSLRRQFNGGSFLRQFTY